MNSDEERDADAEAEADAETEATEQEQQTISQFFQSPMSINQFQKRNTKAKLAERINIQG